MITAVVIIGLYKSLTIYLFIKWDNITSVKRSYVEFWHRKILNFSKFKYSFYKASNGMQRVFRLELELRGKALSSMHEILGPICN